MYDGEAKNAGLTILMVEVNPEQVSQLKNDIPEWNWQEAPPNWISGSSGLPTTDEALDAVIVFAKKKEDEHTLTLCKEIRQHHEMDGIPVLVAINMYQMMLGNEVRRLPCAHFIILPIEKETLHSKLSQIKSGKF